MAENEAELQIIQGNTQLSANLFRIFSASKEKNVVFSPISIHAVLSMVYQGALGKTAEAFASSLKVPDASTAAEGYNVVMDRLNNVPDVTLLMANKIFLMEEYKLLEAFNTAITKQFLSDVQLVDFRESKAAAQTINDWVKEKTHEKIQDLFQEDDLREVVLVLVNAIYFKGNWKYRFDANATKIEPFYLDKNHKVCVPMMHIKAKFYYKYDHKLDVQILQLRYTNEDFSMVIILPNKKDGIKDLEKELQNYDFNEFIEGLWKADINVALPRFKIEQTIDLQDSLTKLGLGEIFMPGLANFRGMSGEDLYVGKAIQKAFIEVNEEGTEAAAVTGITMRPCSGPPRETFFTVDHPFIFELVYKNMVLFVGKIADLSGDADMSGTKRADHNVSFIRNFFKKIF